MGSIVKNMNISTFLTLIFALMLIFGGSIFIVFINMSMKDQALKEAQSKAEIILDRNLATHFYFSHSLKPNLFNFTGPYRSADYFEPTWMSSTYAIREVEKNFKKLSDEDYYYKECAINARSPENEADPFERDFIQELNTDPGLKLSSSVRNIDGEPYFVVLRRGEAMEESCLMCHSEPELAPGGLVDIYGSSRSFSRQEGEVVSAISIRIPLSSAYSEANRLSLKLSAYLVVLLFGLFSLQYIANKNLLFQPLSNIKDKAIQISSSSDHLGEKIPLPTGTELREMTGAFNTMSESLKKGQDDLEKKVEARTLELMEYSRKLEESNNLKDLFRDIMHHDLSNPLGVIRGLAEDRLEDDPDDKDLRLIYNNCSRSIELIEDAIRFSKLETIKELEFEELDIMDIIQRTVKCLKPLSDEAGIEIENKITSPLPIQGNEILTEVFENILSNAIKYASPGKKVLIAGEEFDENIRIRFIDFGAGIKDEDKEVIFERFRRVYKEGVRGSGMGLAIAKRLVDLHRGRIWVEDNPDGGAVFVVELPK